MGRDASKFIWPVTTVICSAIIAAGVYFGLRSNRPPAAPGYGPPTGASGYGAPSAARVVEGAGADRYGAGEERRHHRVRHADRCVLPPGGLHFPEPVENPDGVERSEEAVPAIQPVQSATVTV